MPKNRFSIQSKLGLLAEYNNNQVAMIIFAKKLLNTIVLMEIKNYVLV